MRVPRVLLDESRRALPYVLVLAVLLGAVVVAGAHYSNAWPSEKAEYGWPGPSSLERGVAMVRSDLVLAASIPALLLGARALARRDPAEEGPARLLQVYGVHAALLAAAVYVASIIGLVGSSGAPGDAVLAFWTAHTVLALSFYSLAFLWNCYLREHALAAAAATWLVFLGLYEAVARTIMFRTTGYSALMNGGFPDWFWASQAFSPLSSYTGILILWRPKFRDYMETEALKNAVLPEWLVPATFVGLAVVLWMLLPLALGTLGWWLRGKGVGVRLWARAGTGARTP
jgi:hypothetical protein